MKWCIIFSALLLEATLTLGKIYIREELIHDERALKIREAESVDSRTRTRTRTHTRIPAYSSCILDYDDGGDRVNSILEAKTDAAAMVTITVNPNAPETTITVRPEPDASRDASEFCADFLRHAPTGGAVTKTVLLTSTNTVTVSTAGVTTKTSTNVLPGTTVSALCPIPSTSMTCALSGWGYSTNNIYAGTSIEPPACQQLCLKNTACGSFQVLANNSDPLYTPLCNLYNVTAGGNNTIPGSTSPYAFYDRDCQNFSPSGCTAPKVAMLARDDAASREPTPTFFIGIPSDTLSSVCACVLSTSLGAPPAATRTISSTTFLTKSVTVTLVQTFILTTTVGGTTTVLSSVH